MNDAIHADLAQPDDERLADLEGVIDRARVDAGEALREIRDSRLYRTRGFATFEDYCRERWGMSRHNANRKIGASEILAELVPTGTIDSPPPERHLRELAPLRDAPDQLREAWSEAHERADESGARVTAKLVREVVREKVKADGDEAERVISGIARDMSPELRESLSPEVLRERGEVRRLLGDLTRVPHAHTFVARHRAGLDAEIVEDARSVRAWCDEFVAEMENRNV